MGWNSGGRILDEKHLLFHSEKAGKRSVVHLYGSQCRVKRSSFVLALGFITRNAHDGKHILRGNLSCGRDLEVEHLLSV